MANPDQKNNNAMNEFIRQNAADNDRKQDLRQQQGRRDGLPPRDKLKNAHPEWFLSSKDKSPKNQFRSESPKFMMGRK